MKTKFFTAAAASLLLVVSSFAADISGKWTAETKFAEGDFRDRYFAGDRLPWAVRRVEQVRATIGAKEPDMVTAAIKFGLKPPAVSTVLVGIRNVEQAKMNCGVSDQPAMTDELELDLRKHNWRRAFWYEGM